MDCDNTYKVEQGPLDPSVLTGSKKMKHRSRAVWEGEDDNLLNSRRGDGSFWDIVKDNPIDPRVLKVIQQAGLYGVLRSGRPKTDRSLITALVERWRPETHTFHLRIGEATITLQDVEVLYGLPVDGNAVLGYEPKRTKADWQDMCARLLGFIPNLNGALNSYMSPEELNIHMKSKLKSPLSNEATEEFIHQIARCYIFWMIAGTLLAETTGSLRLSYLTLLEDVDRIGDYSWGSATLACLYRNLCKTSQSGPLEIAGFTPLLQIWAWERLTILRPKVVEQKDTKEISPCYLPAGPRAAAWFAHLSWTNTSQHVLSIYRDALDSMIKGHFIWEPYPDDLIEGLPNFCRAGRNIWLARVPIFCWEIVELHLPDRVLRQFGLVQHIPSIYKFDASHYIHGRRGKRNPNWEQEHAQLLPSWNKRQEHTVDAPTCQGPLQENDLYDEWFRRITVQLIGNPSRRRSNEIGYVPNSTPYEAMVRHIHMMVNKAQSLGDNPTNEQLRMFCAMVKDEGSRCLAYVNEGSRLQAPADYTRSDIPTENVCPSVRERGKGGVAGRRARATEKGRVDGARREADQLAAEDQEGSRSASGVHIENYDIGSTSNAHIENFTRASITTFQSPNTQMVRQHPPHESVDPHQSTFENVFVSLSPDFFEQTPHFNSSPLSLSVEVSDVNNDGGREDNNLEDANDNTDLDSEDRDYDAGDNAEVNNEEGRSHASEMHVAPLLRPQRNRIRKKCGTGSHYIDQHGRKKRPIR